MDDRIGAHAREVNLEERGDGTAPLHFPSEESLDEKVSETKRHLEARTTLYLLLDAFPATAIGSEQFVYFDARDPRKCLSPDLFVKRDAPAEAFDIWKVWERGSPDVAVEIVSASDRRDNDWGDKMARYLQSGVTELVRFDPENERRPIRVWDRKGDELAPRAPRSRALRECRALGLWWVVVPSDFGPMLRLARERDGQGLLPTPGEERIRLAQELAEERRARTLAEHERMLAQHERTLAQQQAREDAEARARAERAQKLAQQKLRRESAARARADAEITRLRAELARLRGQD